MVQPPDNITGDYTIDPSHSRLGFSARHAMVTKVRGQFKDFAGTAHVDTSAPGSSRVDLTLKSASIDTGSADRDGHLTSGDFFGAEENPDITFSSTEVSRGPSTSSGQAAVWTVVGDLTIKGVSKPVTIDFEEVGSARDPFGNVRIGFEGSTTVNRQDWGLTWNAALDTGGVLVSDKIKLEFDISAIQNS
ncbi:MAG: YceI family protein [Actinomycetota bacterium]|nr:YceI family protein [Actinomycetota bacterium]